MSWLTSFSVQAFLAAIGITSSGFAFFVSMGLCSLFGLDYGPMHSIIPCLLVGLGVDDMFVIIQSYNNAEMQDKGTAHLRYYAHDNFVTSMSSDNFQKNKLLVRCLNALVEPWKRQELE